MNPELDLTPDTPITLVETGWVGTWQEFKDDNDQFLSAEEIERIHRDLVSKSSAIIGVGAAYQFTIALCER